MHFCPIAPTKYLDRYCGGVHTQLALAQWCIRSPAYYEWYRKRRIAGDFLILDNGCYEGEMVSSAELIRLSRTLQPSVLAIPDKLDDAEESERLANDFVAEFGYGIPKLMRVLQSSNHEPRAWASMYMAQRGAFEWIAFPRILGKARLSVVEHCLALGGEHPKIHAFGWTGSLHEITRFAEMGVTTIDTSGPVWRGLMGYQNTEHWPDIKFDPSFEYQDKESTFFEQADDNLIAVKRACANL